MRKEWSYQLPESKEKSQGREGFELLAIIQSS